VNDDKTVCVHHCRMAKGRLGERPGGGAILPAGI
jgi:hypothetical protein